MSHAQRPTQRFSNRVVEYVNYRPSYPKEVLPFLIEQIGLIPEWSIADVGSGTGIFTQELLKNGNSVYGVEPNVEMRHYAEQQFKGIQRFHSLDSTAEHTSLENHSVDLITVAQAFHWFDHEKVKKEFTRILKPEHFVVLLWNERELTYPPFLREYESFIQEFGTDYDSVKHTKFSENRYVESFFSPNELHQTTFHNFQDFDFDGLLGRVLSSSYMPSKKDRVFPKMKEALHLLFDRYQTNGYVQINYKTLLYFGKL